MCCGIIEVNGRNTISLQNIIPNIPVEFKFLDAKEHGLICPVVTGTDLYVGGKIKSVPDACVAFGYSFETFVLYAQSLGLGTVWLGVLLSQITPFEFSD